MPITKSLLISICVFIAMPSMQAQTWQYTTPNAHYIGGNVGIGITSPAQLLHVRSASGTDAEIRIDVTSGPNKSILGLANAGNLYGKLYFDNSNNNLILTQNYTDGYLGFGTNGRTNDMVVSNSGNVGIGTTSPQSKLHVRSGAILSSDGSFSNINARIDGQDIPALRFTRWTGSGSIQHNAFVGQFSNPALGEYSFGIGTGSSTSGDQNFTTNVVAVTMGGNVGIGTNTPQYKIDVNGDSRISGSLILEREGDNAVLRIKPLSGNGVSRVVDFLESPDIWNTAYGLVGIANTTWGAPIPSVCLISSRVGSGGPTKDIMMWAHDAPNASNVAMTIKANSGNILIGKTSQTNTSYKLDINGNARANKIVVNTTGADFVFEEDYRLRNLEELQQYIRQNKHLPEIPAAKEMEKEGVDVGALNIKLLQKIEELTLYMIDQHKKLEQQNQEINILKSKMEKMESKK